MSTPNKIALTTRDISGKRSFMTFEEGGEKTIAAVFSKQDLEDLIAALNMAQTYDGVSDTMPRWWNLQEGLEQLLKELP